MSVPGMSKGDQRRCKGIRYLHRTISKRNQIIIIHVLIWGRESKEVF